MRLPTLLANAASCVPPRLLSDASGVVYSDITLTVSEKCLFFSYDFRRECVKINAICYRVVRNFWGLAIFWVLRKLICVIRTDCFFLLGINFCDWQKVPDKSLIIFLFSLSTCNGRKNVCGN